MKGGIPLVTDTHKTDELRIYPSSQTVSRSGGARGVSSRRESNTEGAVRGGGALTKGQEEAVAAVASGANVLCTGCAGTGKSHLLTSLATLLPASPLTAFTALTGVAALLLPGPGSTLHRWAGVGLANGTPQQLLALVEENRQAVLRWKTTQHLVIDEISMLSAALWNKLDFVGRCVRGVDKPWGGIQLVLTGDFAQLPPPVGDFCFKAKTWSEAISRTIVLTESVRQKDPLLFQALSEVRLGVVSDSSLALLNSRVLRPSPKHGILASKLRAKRKDVAAENQEHLMQLPPGGGVIFMSEDRGSGAHFKDLLADLPVPAELRLKVGAQVMLVRSLTPELCNGSRGVVVAFDETQSCFPVVRWATGRQTTVSPATFSVCVGSQELASRKQLPLTLAWAVTIHKSQGMTIDVVDIGFDGIFDYGQSYVALSRCVSLDGLYLSEPLQRKHIRVHPDVAEFYRSLLADSLAPLNASSGSNIGSVDGQDSSSTRFAEVLDDAAGILKGRIFLLEGSFSTRSRKQMREFLESHGGAVRSKNQGVYTHALVGNTGVAASRLDELVAERVEIWSEEDLLRNIAASAKTASRETKRAKRDIKVPDVVNLIDLTAVGDE